MSSLGPATAYTSGAKISRGKQIAERSIKRARAKGKKMGWFKRKFAQWCREAWENSRNEINESEVVSSRDYTGDIHNRHSDERITLRLEKAIGGHIVTVSKYNGKIDRHRENTYLIRDEDNLEEALTGVFISEKLSM
jgi:hypothetical protein